MIANTTSSSNSDVSIVCNRGVGFTFTGGHNIHVKGLNFVGCTGNKLEYFAQFAINLLAGKEIQFNLTRLVQ